MFWGLGFLGFRVQGLGAGFRVLWMKKILDEKVLDETGFGRKCLWMKVFLDETVIG